MPPSLPLHAAVLTAFLLLAPALATAQPSAALRLEPLTLDALAPAEDLPLLDIDTLLYVENFGLERITVWVNEQRFRFLTDPEAAAAQPDALVMPAFGTLTVGIAPLIFPGEGNKIRFSQSGPPEAQANVVVADLLLPGQTIQRLLYPSAVTTAVPFPNPFRERTTLTFTVPQTGANVGAPIEAAVYDLRGRRVQTLFTERRGPGTYAAAWDGRDAGAVPVPSGVYLAVLTVGRERLVQPVVRVR